MTETDPRSSDRARSPDDQPLVGHRHLTTVGYGDVVPVTEKGRIAGVFLMLTGLATLGIVAGTLASAFGVSPADATRSPDGDGPGAEVINELRALRPQLDTIERRFPASDAPP